jgi:hypothetical protein
MEERERERKERKERGRENTDFLGPLADCYKM